MARYRASLREYEKNHAEYLKASQTYKAWEVEYIERRNRAERWGTLLLIVEVVQVIPDGLLVRRGGELLLGTSDNCFSEPCWGLRNVFLCFVGHGLAFRC